MTHPNPGVAVWRCVVILAVLMTAAMSQRNLLPALPASQDDSSLANLWRHGLRNQRDSNGEALRSDDPAPKTYLTPPHGEVMNWVPQDSAHPLYVPENANFLREILFDNMVQVEVKPDDPRMSEPKGLQVTNLNGKTLTFTRDASGVQVEGIPVTDSKINEDGTVSFTLQESLFGHRERVRDAWEKMPKPSARFGPFGGGHPMNAPPPPPPEPF
ncbi:uncharacterized protein LOC135110532 isoform X1 [Scylla paramamosain]|uniref:uncharacterized protein LOC135110532 isoform X1 n=2 Tax=Scylla paramamosain TaxID=85552 RepID=UPI003083D428